MSQIINTNVASLNAQRNLTTSQSSLATSLQRLSSGLRINSAKDDAAGLAISDRMTTQIRGLDQARRNANDGISLAQTAEGALGQTGDILQRIRELAIQSANATNSASDRKALNDEVNQLVQEVNRIASSTSFNGLKILDGSYQGQQYQVGAEANQTIGVSIQGASATDLKSNTLALASNSAGAGLGEETAAANSSPAGNGVAAQTLTIAGQSGSADVVIAANSTAADIASAINAVTADTSVTATASTEATLGTVSNAGTISFTINGGGTATAVSAQISSTSDLTAIATAVNNVSGKTGVTAELSNDKASITFKNADGEDITIDNFVNSGGGTSVVTGAGPLASGVTLTSGGTDSTRVAGTVELASDAGYTAVSNSGTTVLTTGTTASASTSDDLTSVDISTVDGSNDAIKIVDAALQQVNRMRASLGAVQNRFATTITNLQTSSENVSAARSRIRDADFAAETANLTRSQILQQAGVAMLAQANALPNNVLTLLR